MLKTYANVPVESRVFMQKRALREYLAGSVLTEVVRPDGRQCTLKHDKVLFEAIAAGIEPLEFRRRVEKMTRLISTHDPGALFNIIAMQQRDQAIVEANDAERRQTAKRREVRSVRGPTPEWVGWTVTGPSPPEGHLPWPGVSLFR